MKRNNQTQERILRCNGHKCSLLTKKFRKAKTKFCNAGADANANVIDNAEMPMPRFPNGRKTWKVLKLYIIFRSTRTFLFQKTLISS